MSKEFLSSMIEISTITILEKGAGTMRNKEKGLDKRIMSRPKDGRNILETDSQGSNETGITAGIGMGIDTGIMKK